MRRAVWLSEAVRFIIVVLAALVVVSVWPLRLWQRDIEARGGGVRMETSERVDDAHDLMQRFIAQYDRLGSVTVTIDSVESGRYLDFSLLDENYQRLYHKYTDIGLHDESDFPVQLKIPVGAALEVGKEYTLFFMGARSGVHFGLENIPADASPYITSLYVNDTGTELWHLSMKLFYRQPITRGTSLIVIVLALLIALAAERAISFVIRKRGDRIVTVGECVRASVAPIFFLGIAVLTALLAARSFDHRLTDNTFYLLGIVILCLLGAVAFFADGVPAGKRGDENKITAVIEIIQAGALALAIKYCCDYMNGLYDIFHRIAERREAAALAVFLLLFLLGGERGSLKENRIRLNAFGICAVLFFALLIVFRNGRLWGIVLAAFFALSLLCYRFSGRRERWLPVLSMGLALNFLCSVLYCLLHRYFAAFVSGRFSFVFHTVTVTAEYLTMMGAAAFVLLFSAVKRLPDKTPPIKALKTIMPELVFFGSVCAYALFTASRTALLALGSTVIVTLLVCGAGKRGRAWQGLAAAVLSVIILFAPVFTLQRVIPPMVGQPEYMEIEDATPDLRGFTNWDSRFLMSVERFSAVFLDKIAGIEGGSYNYPEDRFNYDDNGEPIYPEISAVPMSGGGGNPAASQSLIEEPDTVSDRILVGYGIGSEAGESQITTTLIEDGNDADRLSNGRLTIWRSYLPYIDLTGHEGMGVPLPNGETAVHAHNVYLQVVYDNGIITGAVFVITLFFAVFAAAVYGRSRGGAAFVPLALTVGFMAAGVSEWNFQFSNMMTVACVFSWMPLCFKRVNG